MKTQMKDEKDTLQCFCLSLQSGIFQEDLYPMTVGNQAAMTAQEWLSGINRGEQLEGFFGPN